MSDFEELFAIKKVTFCFILLRENDTFGNFRAFFKGMILH